MEEDKLQRLGDALEAAGLAALKGDAYDAAREIDCAGAVLIANQPNNVTISAWTGKNRDNGKRWACVFCAFLTILWNLFLWKRVTKDHCTEAMS